MKKEKKEMHKSSEVFARMHRNEFEVCACVCVCVCVCVWRKNGKRTRPIFQSLEEKKYRRRRKERIVFTPSVHLIRQHFGVFQQLMIEDNKVIQGGRDEIDQSATDTHNHVEGDKLAKNVIFGPGVRVHMRREDGLVGKRQHIVHL